MTRTLLLSLVLGATSSLFAQSADLRITSLLADKNSVATGERFHVTMRWRNDGPNAAEGVTATLGVGSGAFVVTGAGTSGWPCEPSLDAEYFICRGTIPAGGEANMVVSFLAPSRTRPSGTFALAGSITAATADPNATNNAALSEIALTRSEREANIGINPSSQTHQARPGENVLLPITVRNAGPSAAENVSVLVSFAPGTRVPLSVSGDGWACGNATHSPWLAICRRDSLAAGQSSPLMIATTAPPSDGTYELAAHVRAERHYDAIESNNSAGAVISVGTPEEWSRVMMPLGAIETPGQNGALWKTETTMLLRGPAPLDVKPDRCDLGPFDIGCTPLTLPLDTPFFPGNYGMSIGSIRPQFVYVRAGEESRLHLNSRVWDVARQTETAGSEIPAVREREFVASTISLLGIPVAPHYRHTLRVYDRDGRAGAQVRISVYANQETTPRATVVRTLTSSDARTTTTALLPIFPAYLELDPAMLTSIAGFATMRIDVEPVDPGTSLWAFVSVTNNETHHVTTFSAQ